MPIKVPADARVVSDQDLTVIRIVKTIAERIVEGDGGLIARVKDRMRRKRADFSESELVIAALRPGSGAGKIDPRKLFKLVGKPAGSAGAQAKPSLTLEQFLECITVLKEPLKKYLPGDTIDGLTSTAKNPNPQLFTEFKEGVEFDLEDVARRLSATVAELVPIK